MSQTDQTGTKLNSRMMTTRWSDTRISFRLELVMPAGDCFSLASLHSIRLPKPSAFSFEVEQYITSKKGIEAWVTNRLLREQRSQLFFPTTLPIPKLRSIMRTFARNLSGKPTNRICDSKGSRKWLEEFTQCINWEEMISTKELHGNHELCGPCDSRRH